MAALADAAAHDALTGLANRSVLLDRLGAALARPGTVAVLFLDLDDFKLINDGLGHSDGRPPPRRGRRSPARGRAARDTVARVGGDEFVVLCEGVRDPEAAAAIARAVRDALAGRSRSAASSATSAPRSAAGSRHDPAEAGASTATRCCATPTSRCTRPRADGKDRAVTFSDAMRGRLVRRLELSGEPAPRARGGRAGAALPAAGRPAHAPARRRRGARALDVPAARSDRARRVHPDRRGERADRAARGVGAAHRVRPARRPGAPRPRWRR